MHSEVPFGATHYRVSRLNKTIYYKPIGHYWYWKTLRNKIWRESRRSDLRYELMPIAFVKTKTLAERLMDAF